MNLFPLIHPSKKAPHFANPLSGLLFHSELEAATKEALSTISYSEASRTRRAGSNASSLKAKSNYKFQLDHSASPDGQLHAAAKSSKVLKAAQLFAERVGQRATLLRSESSLVFQFPDVEIIPLDLVNCYEDIGRYKIKANLEKYFQLFFSKGLRHNLPALNRLLEKYLPLLGKFGVLDREVEKKKWPKEFWEVGRAEELAALMQRYDRPSEYWVRYLLVLVQLYCVPHPAVRQSSLQNLLLLTRHHISHLFESQPHPDCVFLLEDGALVRDFLDIPFSATRLYLTTQKATHQQTVQPYFNLLNTIQNYKEECKKRGFVGRLRRHFRNEIALNKYNEDSVNYEADHSSKEKERKISLYNAMMILQRKKQSQSTHAHTKTLTVSSARPKSREQIWKEENVESGSSHEGGLSKLSFHLYINNPRFQGATRQEFGRYHGLSLQQNQQLQQDRLYVHVLQKQHPVLKAMMGSTFHAPRVKAIFQTIMKEKLSDNRELSRTTISWECFLEFSVLSSKTLGKLIEMPDCMQLVRRFVEDFLGMGGEDYYRDELTSKLYRMIDADRATLSMVEELVWSWLSQNSFVRMGAVQRELLWTYHERSKTFYLLVVSTIFATYSTTPIDLAFELML